MTYRLINLSEEKQLQQEAAKWFSEKWELDATVYLESISSEGLIPSWFVVLDGERIIAGAGVIANDFHDRPDLTPNVCALFAEEEYRGQRLSQLVLDEIGSYFKGQGIETLYLITDHEELYEKFGWEFKTMVKEEDTNQAIRLYGKTH